MRMLGVLASGPGAPGEGYEPDVLAPAEALRGRPRVVVSDDDVAAAVGHGKVLDRSVLGVDGDGPWAVVDTGGRLLAVYQPYDGAGRVKPAVVLPPA